MEAGKGRRQVLLSDFAGALSLFAEEDSLEEEDPLEEESDEDDPEDDDSLFESLFPPDFA